MDAISGSSSNMAFDRPHWVAALLALPGMTLLARLLLTSAYWWGGIAKLADWPGALAEQRHFGLEPAPLFAVATIAVELLGSILVVSGRALWLGAGMLGVFTLIASLISRPFWAMKGAEGAMALNGFLEHLGLIGGLMLAAMLGARDAR